MYWFFAVLCKDTQDYLEVAENVLMPIADSPTVYIAAKNTLRYQRKLHATTDTIYNGHAVGTHTLKRKTITFLYVREQLLYNVQVDIYRENAFPKQYTTYIARSVLILIVYTYVRIIFACNHMNVLF